MTSRAPLVRSTAMSLLAVAASVVIVLVALAVASGATLRPGSDTSYDTEFIDFSVLQLSWLVTPMLGVAAYFSVRVALVGVLGVAVSQFLAMAETVRRYDESGWSDGLEVLGYLFPITLTVVTLGAVLVGWLLGRRARARRSPQPGQDQ